MKSGIVENVWVIINHAKLILNIVEFRRSSTVHWLLKHRTKVDRLGLGDMQNAFRF